MKIAVGITGASGTIYAERLLQRLSQEQTVEQLAVIFTRSGAEVADFERPDFRESVQANERITEYRNDDFFTPVASGSAGFDALLIVPCSMGMIGRIAGGISNDLVSRAADVMLKEERKKLLLCPRETPLSLIHLRNLVQIKEAGGILVPAMPSFYEQPASVEELADTVVDRILAQLGLLPAGHKGWQEE